ncbi:MAG TPA: hypothetical protein VFC00_17660 [Micromonosporaceae bacterium]|nr:hypothetical protein [Micromonosporaceae bacterium]
MTNSSRWSTRLSTTTRVALALGTIGVAYRLALIVSGVPQTNSDEATMGLIGWHMAQGITFPAFIYGQNYMGTVEALLAAPLFALGGPTVLLLRLPMVLAYAVLLFAVYQLTKRLYTPWFAVFVVGLLAFGSDRVIKDQLISNGYAWSVPLGALLLLGAVVLGQRQTRWRLLGFAGRASPPALHCGRIG